MKKMLIAILTLWINQTFAVPTIGTTSLLIYPGAEGFTQTQANFALPKGGNVNLLMINNKVKSTIKQELPKFQAKLDFVLTQAKVFSVFNAKQVLSIWQMDNPQILDTLRDQSVAAIESSAVETSTKPSSKVVPTLLSTTESKTFETSSKKYILLGWITKITVKENRDQIPGTTKTALLYNIEIWVQYKLVEQNTQDVIDQFIAVGHAGIARILPNPNQNISYDTDVLVNDAFNSLASNVLHGLLVKLQQGIFAQQTMVKQNDK